jgi:hypothetical protein
MLRQHYDTISHLNSHGLCQSIDFRKTVVNGQTNKIFLGRYLDDF